MCAQRSRKERWRMRRRVVGSPMLTRSDQGARRMARLLSSAWRTNLHSCFGTSVGCGVTSGCKAEAPSPHWDSSRAVLRVSDARVSRVSVVSASLGVGRAVSAARRTSRALLLCRSLARCCILHYPSGLPSREAASKLLRRVRAARGPSRAKTRVQIAHATAQPSLGGLSQRLGQANRRVQCD